MEKKKLKPKSGDTGTQWSSDNLPLGFSPPSLSGPMGNSALEEPELGHTTLSLLFECLAWGRDCCVSVNPPGMLGRLEAHQVWDKAWVTGWPSHESAWQASNVVQTTNPSAKVAC